MNLTKARDFYSAYHEGTLDEGLKQAFERALANDAAVSAEYQQFVRIMGELRTVARPVSVPTDLHLKIRERVDASINAQEAKAKSGWFFAWRPIAYGAVATAALIGVVASINNRPSPEVSTAGFAAVTSDAAPTVVSKDGDLRILFASSSANSVRVTEVATGRVLLDRALAGQRLDCPVKNVSDAPLVVSIAFGQHYPAMYLAVPGKQTIVATEGAGTVLDLAAVVAGMFKSGIVVESTLVDRKLEWKLDSPDVMVALSDEMKALGLKAEVRENGLVWIGSN
jgi:anti-sigma-K factor RskA